MDLALSIYISHNLNHVSLNNFLALRTINTNFTVNLQQSILSIHSENMCKVKASLFKGYNRIQRFDNILLLIQDNDDISAMGMLYNLKYARFDVVNYDLYIALLKVVCINSTSNLGFHIYNVPYTFNVSVDDIHKLKILADEYIRDYTDNIMQHARELYDGDEAKIMFNMYGKYLPFVDNPYSIVDDVYITFTNDIIMAKSQFYMNTNTSFILGDKVSGFKERLKACCIIPVIDTFKNYYSNDIKCFGKMYIDALKRVKYPEYTYFIDIVPVNEELLDLCELHAKVSPLLRDLNMYNTKYRAITTNSDIARCFDGLYNTMKNLITGYKHITYTVLQNLNTLDYKIYTLAMQDYKVLKDHRDIMKINKRNYRVIYSSGNFICINFTQPITYEKLIEFARLNNAYLLINRYYRHNIKFNGMIKTCDLTNDGIYIILSQNPPIAIGKDVYNTLPAAMLHMLNQFIQQYAYA